MDRQLRIRRALEGVRKRCDVVARRAADPVEVVHRYKDPRDQEIVALLAASIAFGNVKTIRAKLDDAIARLGARPAFAADDELGVFVRMDGWVHRVFRGEDVARLVIGARAYPARLRLARPAVRGRPRGGGDASRGARSVL